MPRSTTCFAFLLVTLALTAPTFAQEVRQWSDASGRFKISATLTKVVDGVVILKNTDGQTLRIPLDKLCDADREFIAGGINPFEMVEETPASPFETVPAASSGTPAVAPSSGGTLWMSQIKVDWDAALRISTPTQDSWQVAVPNGVLQFEPKRASISGKANFHERDMRLIVNAKSKRAVVGRSYSFGRDEPSSRLSLVDLTSGKSVEIEPQNVEMLPLAMLDNGSMVVMRGNARRDGMAKSKIELWRMQGKSVKRSGTWEPYAGQGKGGTFSEIDVVKVAPINGGKVVMISNKGHVALWDLPTRTPIWHHQMSKQNFAMAVSADRSLLALFDERTLFMVDPLTGDVKGSKTLPSGTATGWVRLAWGPTGKKIMMTSRGDVRVLDVATGEWDIEITMPSVPVAANGMCFPHPDYALLNNSTLLHLPSKIKVCTYSDAGSIFNIGGTSFIALHGDRGGVVVPAKFPHPAAESALAKALDDPTTFLLHPGVGVAVSASGGQHSQAIRSGLEKSVVASGYKLDPNSPIKITGSVTGPKQEAVSYHMSGSYIVQKYTSSIKMQWNGKDVWQRSWSNIPGMLMTKRGESMQQALDKHSKSPNITSFAATKFPAFMQKPAENGRTNGGGSLMSSKFTLQGLADSP